MEKNELRSKLKEKPAEPGVYIFRKEEVPLYVGKAVDIRDRLRSYTDPRTVQIEKMVEKADRLDHRTTQDEKEALLLEANLIKKYQPKYNIRLKDGKSYPVIEITSHKFPGINATRDPNEDSTVFGPFTEMRRVENAIKAVRDIYGVRGCSDRKFSGRDRPCLDYQMGICSAPCVGKISEKEYREKVEKTKQFFQDSSSNLLEEIEQKMSKASEEKRFERAGTLRDYIDDLKNLRGNKKIRDTGVKHVLAVNPKLDRIGLVVVEKNSIKDKRFYRLNEQAESRLEALEAFVKQFYATDNLPEQITTQVEIEDPDIRSWLEDEGVSFGEPEHGRDRILLESAEKTSEKTENSKMEKLEEILGLEIIRIECFDVSHTGGKKVVGSNIVFEDDKPLKKDYRRKKLVEKNDDYDNMYELLKWRAKRSIEGRDKRKEPDLILIDGGRGQLNAAARAMRETGWSKPVFAIVKPDDDILGLHKNPEIPEDVKTVLSAARDESHRFAVNYHSSRRDKIESVLEEIEGIGEEKRKELMEEYSLSELRELSKEELTDIEGIGPKLAEKIKKNI